jgi:lipoprotein-anchoring transpeptidase ErfK/SrfK
VLPTRNLKVAPVDLGAVAYIKAAISRALHARPGSRVPVKVVVHEDVTRVWLTDFASRFDQADADARVFLRNLTPVVAKAKTGRQLDRKAALHALVDELATGRRTPIKLPFTLITPKVKDDAFSSIIVIRRGSNHLYLYNGEKLVRDFGVATGQSIYPTPLGRTQIVVKWANPWWYPPASPWAKGLKPVPPGPGNPLGTRWMGLGFSGVGIHGTPDASSIGYSASHGCIRMLIPNAEWLFDHVNIGTPVFIVSA